MWMQFELWNCGSSLQIFCERALTRQPCVAPRQHMIVRSAQCKAPQRKLLPLHAGSGQAFFSQSGVQSQRPDFGPIPLRHVIPMIDTTCRWRRARRAKSHSSTRQRRRLFHTRCSPGRTSWSRTIKD